MSVLAFPDEFPSSVSILECDYPRYVAVGQGGEGRVGKVTPMQLVSNEARCFVNVFLMDPQPMTSLRYAAELAIQHRC